MSLSKVVRLKRHTNRGDSNVVMLEEAGGMPTVAQDPLGFYSVKDQPENSSGGHILSAVDLYRFLQHEAASRAAPGWECAPLYSDHNNPGYGQGSVSHGQSALEVYAPATSFPRMLDKQLARVDYWIENDELVERLVTVKEEISVMGFTLRCSRRRQAKAIEEKEKADLAEFRDDLELIEKKWDWHSIASDLLREWLSKDTMILYWKLAKNDPTSEGAAPPSPGSKEETIPGLIQVCSLNPADCNWNNSFGQDQLEYRIHWQIEKKIRDVLDLSSGPELVTRLKALLAEGIEQKYIDAVKANKRHVILRKEDGDRWLVRTRGSRLRGFRKPTMTSVFAPLEIRRSVADGEFAAAFLMKHFIMHVTQGESIDQGPLAGQRMNWAGTKEIKALNEMLKKTNKASRVATDHTVKFNFVFPPKEMFDPTKYQKAEARIYNWGGVTVVLMTGDGGTNASGFIGIKRLTANLANARKQIKLALFEFFDSPEIKNATEMPENCNVSAAFDENVLKDPKQLLDELRTMLEGGWYDPALAIDELGRDSQVVKDAKAVSIEENKTTGLWQPLVIPNNRQESQASAGRPPNPGTTPNEDTRLQSPPS